MEQTSADRPIATLTGDTLVEIAPEATLRDVAALLVDGAVIGIVSARDLLGVVAGDGTPEGTEVR